MEVAFFSEPIRLEYALSAKRLLYVAFMKGQYIFLTSLPTEFVCAFVYANVIIKNY